jgi:uncharacterized protein (DUF433 family)/DNA-binding transcriptional MerR regulator
MESHHSPLVEKLEQNVKNVELSVNVAFYMPFSQKNMNNPAATSQNTHEPWISRLSVPTYRPSDAARYAGISTHTILNWQREQSNGGAAISNRDNGQMLSYLQLIEVAVVAAMRKAGVPLGSIRAAKKYLSEHLESPYPFALHCFKTDGKKILMNLSDFVPSERDKLISLNDGQLGWQPILQDKLQEFDYHADSGIVEKWHVSGPQSGITIDPRVSFGSPAIHGIPTWTIKGRLDAGESINDIADDFSIQADEVKQALKFEGVRSEDIERAAAWSL